MLTVVLFFFYVSENDKEVANVCVVSILFIDGKRGTGRTRRRHLLVLYMFRSKSAMFLLNVDNDMIFTLH